MTTQVFRVRAARLASRVMKKLWIGEPSGVVCVSFFRLADFEAALVPLGRASCGRSLALHPRTAAVPTPAACATQRRRQVDIRKRARTRCDAVVNLAYQKIDPLVILQALLHQGQPFVGRHTIGGRESLRRLACPDHIDSIQKFFSLDCILLSSPSQESISHGHNKMFCYLVMVNYFACSHADLGRLFGGLSSLPCIYSLPKPPVRPVWPPAVRRLERRCSAS